jgi:hypothetical protein
MYKRVAKAHFVQHSVLCYVTVDPETHTVNTKTEFFIHRKANIIQKMTKKHIIMTVFIFLS